MLIPNFFVLLRTIRPLDLGILQATKSANLITNAPTINDRQSKIFWKSKISRIFEQSKLAENLLKISIQFYRVIEEFAV
jgi:hypothetical protein